VNTVAQAMALMPPQPAPQNALALALTGPPPQPYQPYGLPQMWQGAKKAGTWVRDNPEDALAAAISLSPVGAVQDMQASGRDFVDAAKAGDWGGMGLGVGGMLLGAAGLVPGEGTVARGAAKVGKVAGAADRKALGYADDVFYRGEAKGVLPNEYPGGAFFSRDKEYATGFARKGGGDAPREFRLNLQNTLSDQETLTAARYGRLIASAAADDPALAAHLVENVAAGKTPQWFIEFARRNPDYPLEGLSVPFIRQVIDTASKSPETLYKRAGFDALDSGRDVRKLTGAGIRLSNAKFDPARASDWDITAAILTSLGLGGAYGLAPESQQESRF
jgi:hypothetical protein